MAIRGGLGVALLLALGMSVAGCSSAHIKRTEMGYASFYEGDLDQAQADFEAALKKHGDYEPALTGMGMVALERGQYQDARRLFDQAIAAEKTADALYGRGVTFLKLFQWDEAERDLASAAGAQLDEANMELAVAGMLVGDDAEALKAAQTYASVQGAEQPRRLQAAAAAYRSGIKFNVASKGLAVVNAFDFPDGSEERHEANRMAIDLAVLSADYSEAMRLARKADKDLDFGFSYRELSPVAARRFEGLGGAVIDYVHIGSPAERGGLLPGDVVTGFRAVPVTSAAQLSELIAGFEAQIEQQRVALVEVLRDDAYYAAYLEMGAFQFDERIREIRDGGQGITLTLAPDDMAMWP